MYNIDMLINKLDESGLDIFWFDGASEKLIDLVELSLDVKFPRNYRYFLSKSGGGGVVGNEISLFAFPWIYKIKEKLKKKRQW